MVQVYFYINCQVIFKNQVLIFSDQLISIAKKIIPEASFEVQDANEISTKRKLRFSFFTFCFPIF